MEALGPADPDLDVEVIALADGFYRALGLSRLRRCTLNSMGDGTLPPGLPRRCCAGYLAERRGPAVRRARASASRPTRCGSSTASGPSAGPPPPRRPGFVDHLCEDCAPHFDRVQRGPARRSASPSRSTTAWSGASTTTPGPPSSSPRRRSTRPRTPSGAAAATTAWSRCWAARPPRASASASASSGSCWPATPKGSFAVDPPPLDVFVVDVTGGEAARDLTRGAPAGRPARRPGLRRPLDASPR